MRKLSKNHWLYTLPVAHRGLHGKDVPENSLTSFRLAMEAGYAVETDLHLTKDGVLVAFHDDTLTRMTGAEGNIKEKTYAELAGLTLANSQEKIPTFDEMLNLISGKVPLLIELKSNGEKGLEKAVCNRLKTYNGAYALQSFDPFILRRVKKCAPEMLRGQLSSFFEDQKFGFWKRLLLKRMFFNFLTKPNFISYNAQNLPYPPAQKKEKPLLCWTVRTEDVAQKMKTLGGNLIFEDIRPALPPVWTDENHGERK